MSIISKNKLSIAFLVFIGLQLQLATSSDSFVYNFNNVTYGSNATSCYNNCKRGQLCTVRGAVTTCKPLCTDGIVVGTEAVLGGCDDGNRITGDGCNKCTVEPLWSCTGSPSVCSFKCGNGLLQKDTGEQCDDGNRRNGDGCTANCQIVPSWMCTDNANALSICTPICGDGKIIRSQQCDDGNTVAGDGCSATCTIESGFFCSGLPTKCVYKCGNSIVDSTLGEVCDNGINGAGDGCSDDCQTVEDGWACNQINGKSGRCTPICGDGKLIGIETQIGYCDDGNLIPGDGCSSICVINMGYTCTGNPSVCTPICGDGKLVGIETKSDYCDDGNTINGDGCENCLVKNLYSCKGTPSVCLNLCGNSRFNYLSGEECDNGPSTVNNDGCDDITCTIQSGWYCTQVQFVQSICTTRCGDGIVALAGAEQCDDRNTNNGDGCSSTCKIQP